MKTLRVFPLALLGVVQVAQASTGTTLDGATSTFSSLFLLGVFLLGGAGLTTIVYTIAKNRYGVIWDEALAVVKAVAVGASFVTILGWVGSTAAAPLPQAPLALIDIQVAVPVRPPLMP